MKKDTLRRMNEADLEQVLSWRNSYSVRENMFNQHKISYEEHEEWFRNLSAYPDQHHLLVFEKMSGICGFISFEQSQYGYATWGFYKAPESGRGVGFDMCTEALSYAFDKIEVNKVVGQVIDFNVKSIDFHKKIGFKQESELREHYFRSDKYYNILSFGLLKAEWVQMKGNYE